MLQVRRAAAGCLLLVVRCVCRPKRLGVLLQIAWPESAPDSPYHMDGSLGSPVLWPESRRPQLLRRAPIFEASYRRKAVAVQGKLRAQHTTHLKHATRLKPGARFLFGAGGKNAHGTHINILCSDAFAGFPMLVGQARSQS